MTVNARRPTNNFHELVPGKCRKIVDGKRCNVEFKGPRRRKYCNEHSPSVKLRGRGQ